MNKLKKIKKSKSKEKELSNHSKNNIIDKKDDILSKELHDEMINNDINKNDILIKSSSELSNESSNEILSESYDNNNSKEQCIKIIKDSIQEYLNCKEEIDIDTKDNHYKCWLEAFSIEDFNNEFKNSLSGNYYNNLYHNLWDDYFDTHGFIILNNIN